MPPYVPDTVAGNVKKLTSQDVDMGTSLTPTSCLLLRVQSSSTHGDDRKRYPRQPSSTSRTPQVRAFAFYPTSLSLPFPRSQNGVPHTPLQQRATFAFARAGPALHLIDTKTQVPSRKGFRNVRQGIQLVFRSRSDYSDPGQRLNSRSPPLLIIPHAFKRKYNSPTIISLHTRFPPSTRHSGWYRRGYRVTTDHLDHPSVSTYANLRFHPN